MQHRLQLAERLGFGIHGIIFVAKGNVIAGKTAIKVHRYSEPFVRERSIYERLKEAAVTEILGFSVPQLYQTDDNLKVIEMSIVTRPFVLDFAGAYLDALPEFPEEKWAEWEAEKREQFDERWPMIINVINALEELDVYMVDVSPSNIAFPN